MLTIEHLCELLERHRASAQRSVHQFDIGGRLFRFNGSPSIMGVVNLSADSWYRESVSLTADAAIKRSRVLAAQGADLIDIGAESTLAQAARADVEKQMSLLLPVIRQLTSEGILISVETYDATVAERSLAAGAQVLNLTGAEHSERIYPMAAEANAAVIICYVQGKHVRDTGELKFEADPIDAMKEYFAKEIDLAERAGLRRILIDPGLGFYYKNLTDSAERVRYQIATFLQTFRLRTLGYPVCHALPHAFEYFAEEVRTAEPFFAVLAALGKTDLFRTHEVAKVHAVLTTMRAF